jgi:hypothetical protein
VDSTVSTPCVFSAPVNRVTAAVLGLGGGYIMRRSETR